VNPDPTPANPAPSYLSPGSGNLPALKPVTSALEAHRQDEREKGANGASNWVGLH